MSHPAVECGAIWWKYSNSKVPWPRFFLLVSLVDNWQLKALKGLHLATLILEESPKMSYICKQTHIKKKPDPQILYQRSIFHKHFTWHWHLRMADLKKNSAFSVCRSGSQSSFQWKDSQLHQEKENKLPTFYVTASPEYHITDVIII